MARNFLFKFAAMVGLWAALVIAESPLGAQELRLLKPGGKINIVFLAEAYLASQKQVFLDDADLAWKTIFARTPFKENAEKFSVYAIWVVSQDSVLSDTKGQTYFGSSATGSTWPDNFRGVVNSFFPMKKELTFPYLLINANKPTGSGAGLIEGFLSTYMFTGFLRDKTYETGHEFFRYATVHEFAHSFAGLADEYEGNRTTYPGETFDENEFPNITRETRREFIKWRKFIELSTSLPTPESSVYADAIGLFDGAFVYKKGQGWYRPSLYCLMGNRNGIKDERINRFCKVCQDQIEQRLATLTAIREKPPEADFSATARQGQPPLKVAFTAVSKGGPIMEYRWNFGDGETLTAYANQPGADHVYEKEGSYTITLAVSGPGGVSASTVKDFVIVSAQKPTPDFDSSGLVDFTDFFFFADSFGSKTALSNIKFDLDGDGQIGLGDFFIFANAFGQRM